MKGGNFVVRPGLAGDADGVQRLASELTTAFPFDHGAFRPAYAAVLDNPAASLVVAERDGEVVGYLLGYRHATFWAGADVWWVEELFVGAGHRSHGIGQALMEYFEEQARTAGGKLVCLITRKAADFYRAVGYEEFAVYFRKVL